MVQQLKGYVEVELLVQLLFLIAAGYRGDEAQVVYVRGICRL